MKSMKVRKLAALGVAAALAAAPVAVAAVHAENLPTDRDWYLQSNIVVGAKAIASDVVAAADIAAAIAELAYQKAEISGGDVEDAKVKLSVPGEIVVGGEVYVDVSVKVVSRVSTVVYVPADGAVEVAEESGDPEVLVTAAPGGDFVPVRVGKGRPLSEVVRLPLERLTDGDLVAKVFFRDGRGNGVTFKVPVGLPRESIEGLLSEALGVRD